jgi:hypothetical protein
MPPVIEHIHFKWFIKNPIINKIDFKKVNWQKVVSGLQPSKASMIFITVAMPQTLLLQPFKLIVVFLVVFVFYRWG